MAKANIKEKIELDSKYPYSGKNLFKNPEYYFYADCSSSDYLKNWKKHRNKSLKKLKQYCDLKRLKSDSDKITSRELKELLYVYASDYFGGRETGTKGQKIAVDFLKEYYKNHSIDPAKGTDDYFQYIKNIKTGKYYLGKQFIRSGVFDSENVVSIIQGSKFPNEYIVLSAHLDAHGTHGGKIYNGADDDGSGNVSLLEIAESFSEAVKDGFPPKRSIIFLHVTAEEKGITS